MPKTSMESLITNKIPAQVALDFVIHAALPGVDSGHLDDSTRWPNFALITNF